MKKISWKINKIGGLIMMSASIGLLLNSSIYATAMNGADFIPNLAENRVWEKDPFERVIYDPGKTRERGRGYRNLRASNTASEPKYKVSAIYKSKRSGYKVIINNQRYQVGDTIDQLTIKRITDEMVTLQGQNGKELQLTRSQK
tara:strand:- start:49 stop:480 length:432 start_codon:yes stop_codon:yes gene_type:complete